MKKLLEIPVEQIDRDPNQPRTHFDEVALAELAESIREHGVIQPVEVEATGDGRYKLHHGERRWRAAKLAGLATVPAVVAEVFDDEVALIRGLLENLHREDLNPIDEANVYARLVAMGWARTRVCREVGRSPAHVAGRMAWLEMEPEIQKLVALGQLPISGELALALAKLAPEVRVPLVEKMVTHALSLKACLNAVDRAAEKLARREEAERAGKERQRDYAREVVAGPAHPVPMVRYGAPGVPVNANGNAPKVGRAALAAAKAMCDRCSWRPRGEVIPSWEIVEAAAAATCAECARRDGYPLPAVCENCPGVAMLKALVGVGDGQ